MEWLRFAKEYVASPKLVGGFAPSSRRLGEVVTETAGVRDAEVVVEFGPGTGVFTEIIARKLKTDAKCVAIEIREDFVNAVRERCPGVDVVHGSAADARAILDGMGLDGCDCIVSGLPFALFEDALQNAILDAAQDVLTPGGVFVTFTYFLAHRLPRGKKLRRKLEQRFGNVETTPVVWLNVFPAFAYRAVKEKGAS